MEYREDVAEELCPVCDDKVSGYHYGLLTCESCKGFFKRTVQNNKRYICAKVQKCRIDKAQRKRCPFCRFQKCLEVGMRLEAVRADRMRGGRNKFGPMYKRDRALKQQRKAVAVASSLLTCSQTWTPGGSGPVSPESLPPLPETNPWSDPRDQRDPRVPAVPPLVLELLCCNPDEIQVQRKIRLSLQQHRPGPERPPSLFSLMLLLAEHTLFSIVDWARSSVFFKQLEVSDQMTLLHSCWSELLVLDVICRQVLSGKPGRLLLITGHEVDLSAIGCQAGPILLNLIQMGQNLTEKLQLLKVDRQEFVCMKFLIVFNSDGKQLVNHLFVERVRDQLRGALLEYALSSQYLGRFTQLLQCLSEVHLVSSFAEDYLWSKHQSGELPCNSLLSEMLHAQRSKQTHT